MMKKFCLSILLLLCFALPLGPSAFATTFDNLVVFGDSLSDNGNVARFSDGDIWVEKLANSMKATLYDYAYGGATTGYDNPAIGSSGTGLQWQVDGALNIGYGHTTFAGSTMVSVWAGANDFLQGRLYNDAANNIGLALESLYVDGFRDFLVPNLPNIGSAPAFQAGDPVAAAYASFWTMSFNTALAGTISTFASTKNDVTLYDLDIYSAFSSFQVGSAAWGELFWVDGFHPSSVGHELIYGLAASAIPEPATAILFGIGLLGITGVSRKKRLTV
ncbi:MAG: PEP-CTERM sorting domain-containing protein [Proteobacteria bacterium]|nr:PEP-CTERM sorting domain-containing protein [Pseudomonadota bacterium]MBU1584435.1 PEP-CTERM sorting domain-containing protein [Pseudomonadota bacterium]MBU2627804.1 PEP-CTERM sorting domain-containing protein [Pseudomonadota bacterium]